MKLKFYTKSNMNDNYINNNTKLMIFLWRKIIETLQTGVLLIVIWRSNLTRHSIVIFIVLADISHHQDEIVNYCVFITFILRLFCISLVLSRISTVKYVPYTLRLNLNRGLRFHLSHSYQKLYREQFETVWKCIEVKASRTILI